MGENIKRTMYEEIALMEHIRETHDKTDLCALYYMALSIISDGCDEGINVIHNDLLNDCNMIKEDDNQVKH